ARMPAWEKSFSKKPTWEPVKFLSANAKSTATITPQPDGSLLVGGKPPIQQELYTVVVESPLKEITGLRLEVLPDPSLPPKGPGRAANGNFVLHELRVQAQEINAAGKPGKVGLFNAQATFSQATFEVAKAIDNNPGTGWAIAPRFGQPTEAMFQFQKPLKFAKGAKLTVVLDQHFGTNHVIGKFRLTVTGTPGMLSLPAPPAHPPPLLPPSPTTPPPPH